MSSGLNLGMAPETLRVILTTGADFLCTLKLDEPWPTGTTLTLKVGTASWVASIAGDTATFDIDKAQADAVADKAAASLVYTNGTTDQVWAVGTVSRRG